MHGGHDVFAGKLGVEFSSPSDPMGLNKLRQLEALCRHHLAKTDEKNDELDEQIVDTAGSSHRPEPFWSRGVGDRIRFLSQLCS